jgi:hypothetical protein
LINFSAVKASFEACSSSLSVILHWAFMQVKLRRTSNASIVIEIIAPHLGQGTPPTRESAGRVMILAMSEPRLFIVMSPAS